MDELEIESVESFAAEIERFRGEVHAGLSAEERSISPKWLYDAEGSRLFEKICDLDEYYPTRTERCIYKDKGAEIAAAIGPRARVVEPGSGDGSKARRLLDLLDSPTAYIPVEISAKPLEASVRKLSSVYPELPIQGVRADFTRPFELPPPPPETDKTIVFFPGSTLGNFERRTALELLRTFREVACERGGLLIGADLEKSTDVLLPAYDDAEGVTARFNKNLLVRMKRELGAKLDVEGFVHRARYERSPSRVVLELVARGPQTIELDGRRYEFAPGDALRTEYSHKPSPDDFAAQAATAGWEVDEIWTDDRGWFGVFLLRAA